MICDCWTTTVNSALMAYSPQSSSRATPQRLKCISWWVPGDNVRSDICGAVTRGQGSYTRHCLSLHPQSNSCCRLGSSLGKCYPQPLPFALPTFKAPSGSPLSYQIAFVPWNDLSWQEMLSPFKGSLDFPSWQRQFHSLKVDWLGPWSHIKWTPSQ